MRKLYLHGWPLCKLSFLICFWFSRITLNDMNTLLIRGADERQKAWRLWLCTGYKTATPETTNSIAVIALTNASTLNIN